MKKFYYGNLSIKSKTLVLRFFILAAVFFHVRPNKNGFGYTHVDSLKIYRKNHRQLSLQSINVHFGPAGEYVASLEYRRAQIVHHCRYHSSAEPSPVEPSDRSVRRRFFAPDDVAELCELSPAYSSEDSHESIMEEPRAALYSSDCLRMKPSTTTMRVADGPKRRSYELAEKCLCYHKKRICPRSMSALNSPTSSTSTIFTQQPPKCHLQREFPQYENIQDVGPIFVNATHFLVAFERSINLLKSHTYYVVANFDLRGPETEESQSRIYLDLSPFMFVNRKWVFGDVEIVFPKHVGLMLYTKKIDATWVYQPIESDTSTAFLLDIGTCNTIREPSPSPIDIVRRESGDNRLYYFLANKSTPSLLRNSYSFRHSSENPLFICRADTASMTEVPISQLKDGDTIEKMWHGRLIFFMVHKKSTIDSKCASSGAQGCPRLLVQRSSDMIPRNLINLSTCQISTFNSKMEFLINGPKATETWQTVGVVSYKSFGNEILFVLNPEIGANTADERAQRDCAKCTGDLNCFCHLRRGRVGSADDNLEMDMWESTDIPDDVFGPMEPEPESQPPSRSASMSSGLSASKKNYNREDCKNCVGVEDERLCAADEIESQNKHAKLRRSSSGTSSSIPSSKDTVVSVDSLKRVLKISRYFGRIALCNPRNSYQIFSPFEKVPCTGRQRMAFFTSATVSTSEIKSLHWLYPLDQFFSLVHGNFIFMLPTKYNSVRLAYCHSLRLRHQVVVSIFVDTDNVYIMERSPLFPRKNCLDIDCQTVKVLRAETGLSKIKMIFAYIPSRKKYEHILTITENPMLIRHVQLFELQKPLIKTRSVSLASRFLNVIVKTVRKEKIDENLSRFKDIANIDYPSRECQMRDQKIFY